jgi:hypothetical protein
MQHNQFPQDDPCNLFPRSAKMIFPKFDGGEPSEWIYKANQYFFVYNTPPEFKNLQASYNMEGKALVWFQDLFHSGQLPNWDALTQALLERFGSSAYDDPMESLTRLRQQTSVEDYKGKFEILSNRLRDFSEGYKLSCFLSGLKEEIRLPVRMFAPKMLLAAYGLAKIQEDYVLNSRRAYRSPVGNFSNVGNYKSGGPPATGSGGNGAGSVKTAVPIQKISPAQMEEMRKKGLCYSCDAKWHTGHKCPNPRLFVIESVELIEEERAAPFLEQQELMEFDYNDGHPEISLHAITGSNHPKTIRIIGKIGNQRVVILIDSGSTHNFLDSSIVQHSQLPLVKENQIRVQIANGDHIVSEGKFVGVQVEVQNFQFITEAFVIVLAGCDMVLGVQWLVSLGSILWNFKYLTMEFSIANNSFRLQGLATPKLLLEATGAAGTGEGNKGIFLQLLNEVEDSVAVKEDMAVSAIVEEFLDVFAEPTGLPPSRSHDHAIILKQDAQPVSVRPYRYPYYQKEEIEKIVRKLLESEVIQPSQSPFSSPVLLVRKADGSWRMCMDYRALNKETMKDKFPILVIDELLDELHGSRIYSKLDLRSGYHQILVKPEDVPKTTFRTHEGH